MTSRFDETYLCSRSASITSFDSQYLKKQRYLDFFVNSSLWYLLQGSRDRQRRMTFSGKQNYGQKVGKLLEISMICHPHHWQTRVLFQWLQSRSRRCGVMACTQIHCDLVIFQALTANIRESKHPRDQNSVVDNLKKIKTNAQSEGLSALGLEQWSAFQHIIKHILLLQYIQKDLEFAMFALYSIWNILLSIFKLTLSAH